VVPFWLSIILVIVIGAVLRLCLFDLMEFKADEVNAILLTEHWLNSGIPQFGLMSGVGIMNPPGFVIILLPVISFSLSPLVVGFYIAGFNIVSIWLIYRLGVILGSPRGGFWAGAYLAVHPWLILYSRKIWAQSLLPFFILLILITLARCSRSKYSRCIFWVVPLIALTWQIHYSVYGALIFIVIWFAAEVVRRRVNWRWFLPGLAFGLIIFAPYLYYSMKTGFKDFLFSYQQMGRGTDPLGIIYSQVKVWAETSFSGGFGYPFALKPISLALTPLGLEKPWLQPLAGIGTFLVIFFAVLGLSLRRRESRTIFRFEVWLALFSILPLLLYMIRGRGVSPHYFIAGIPAVLMLAGLGTEKFRSLLKKNRGKIRILASLSYLGGMIVILSGILIWLSFILYINRTGGTGGDYGIAYRFQANVAEALVADRVSPEAIDARLTRDDSIGIFYLLKYKFNTCPPYASRRERIVDILCYPDWRCLPGEILVPLSGRGPLKRYLVPYDEKAVR
jgi:hypothetical protein